jgi:GH24 family phage-related lysozyme (muramidase)
MMISRGQADKILARDLIRYEEQVLHEVKAPLTQWQFDALVSFTYNAGEGSLRWLVAMSHASLALFPVYMLHFDRAGGKVLSGLVRRRKAEAAMFQDHYPLGLQVKLVAKKVLAAISTNHPMNEDDEEA